MENEERPTNYGRIMSFSLRGKRLGDKFEHVMEEHGADYLVPFEPGVGQATIAPGSRIDLSELFGREAPLIVEVGPGSGEQLVHAAKLYPEKNFLACEAWGPGVARCVNALARENLSNVKIAELDAAQALPIIFGTEADESLRQYASEVWTFFPDPWRKKKHRKRRIVSPTFAHVVAGILQPAGIWRMATDWDNYAWQMRDVIQESPWFSNAYAGENPDAADEGVYRGGFAPRFSDRVMTRFEERGIEAGRSVHDVLAVRNSVKQDEETIPEDPWVSAIARGETVLADRGGERPPSSRRGLKALG
ncbi:tRNA (guanosine(46)-N7)-methyltransferase TrmB [Arcanobacterium ihumii]|uniref:tRNA (guanosine(46)-N7)-methyltransferase TrmB n=1 Tax=Arcanobacterium ihumii TaxID=2138162 RepID=UPI001F28746E|nr:tRNA (guanosine(46)-N7)-methyltransferase TrmB [Arcanobacterium ihumii]